MKKITIVVLFICMLSLLVAPAMAAQDTTPGDRVITPAQMAANKLQELNEMKVFEQRATHSKADFTNAVPGVGGLKYEGEQVPKGFEHVPETITMVSWHDNGRLHIRDTVHKTTTIQVPWATLQEIKGFDSQHVRIWHYDDSGVCDGKWVQKVSNEGGYGYLESVPFSEVVVGGYTGTYSKVESEIDITDTITLGRTFDSDDVSSLTLEIDDQYSSKTDPYDIDTTGLVALYRFDDPGSAVIDYSGNGNNGTFAAATYTEGKYNNGGMFDGVDDSVQVTENILSQTMTISMFLKWNNFEDTQFQIKNLDTNTTNLFYHAFDSVNLAIGWRRDNNGNDQRIRLEHTDVLTSNDEYYHIVAIIDSVGGQHEIYVNGVKKYTTLNTYSLGIIETPIEFGCGSFNGSMDEIQIYNRVLSQDEIEQLYYIKSQEIQIKTNSNVTYSDYWNSSADNPLSVPFGASESISSLTFNQPESIEQNGITIYDPINVLMNVTATVGYTEDTYMIEEFCDEGFYIDQYAVEISHTPSADNANGQITYNPTDSMCSDIMGKSWTYELESNNPAASITTFNQNSLVIDTGAITAGTEYTYTVIAETSDEVANTELESDISSAIAMSGILPMLLVMASILALLIGMMTGAIDYAMAVKSVGAVIFLSVVLYVGIAILNTIATALG